MTGQEKDALRHEAIRHRDRIEADADNSDLACSLFFDSIRPTAGQIVALYWAKGREFNPDAILERLLREGFQCALPVVKPGSKTLSFALWDESRPLVEGPYGLQQPVVDAHTAWVDPDIVIVPLLAFDRKGGRLGYGSGYYDVTLRGLRQKKSIIAVGLAYAQQAVLFNLPAEPHDEPMDWVITPQKRIISEIHLFNSYIILLT